MTESPKLPAPILQDIGMLNLRISDMMMQLNRVLEKLVAENAALTAEINKLKSEKT